MIITAKAKDGLVVEYTDAKGVLFRGRVTIGYIAAHMGQYNAGLVEAYGALMVKALADAKEVPKDAA